MRRGLQWWERSNEQRPHQQERSAAGVDVHRGLGGDAATDLVITELAVFMAAGKDAKRAALGSGVLEVNTKQKHLFEHRRGRLDFEQAGFRRPGSVSGDVHSFAHGDPAILMPAAADIALVEYCRPDDHELPADGRPDVCAELLMPDQLQHGWMAGEVANAAADAGVGVRQRRGNVIALKPGQRNVRGGKSGRPEIDHVPPSYPGMDAVARSGRE